jgi:uncharacterized membrane protein YkvA (DUF1232 family)
MTLSNSLWASSLPAKTEKIFLPLCQELPEGEVEMVKREISDYLHQVRTRITQNEFLDLSMAAQISTLLHFLLDRYPTYTREQKALIIGAARYFIKEDDAEHDVHSLLGLDDDAMVLNFVLDATNHADKKIAL